MSESFVHLHVHSEYSLLDGACRVSSLCRRTAEDGAPGVALTDHGVMYGALEFYYAAREHSLVPIVGCEAYIAPRGRFDRTVREEAHVTLLAADLVGYRNLVALISKGFLEGYYYKPRIDLDLLEKHNDGLIVLSGCMSGLSAQKILKNDYVGAKKAAQTFVDIFGDRFYVEIMRHGIPEQDAVNDGLIKLAREMNLPLVATNDSHYLNRDDASWHDVLLCIGTGKTLGDMNRLKFASDEFYVKSNAEMRELFADVPDAVENTVAIAKRIDMQIPEKQFNIPLYPVPQAASGSGNGQLALVAPADKTAEEYLRERCEIGLVERYGAERAANDAALRERLDYEISVINSMGFASYFLIVWDFIKYARDHDIPVGPGRGSAVGSVVSYVLRITDLDPIKFNLIFERFLNPARISMPDIDTDFCVERRDEVIEYVTAKYGKEHVAQIVTFGTMAARAAIRDAGRALGVPLPEVDRVAKLIPSGPNGLSVDQALKSIPELKNLADNSPAVRQLLDTASSLEGLARHASTHAAGVVISKEPLVDVAPLITLGEGDVNTQYDMIWVERIGLLKMDFLGLRNLTVMKKAVDEIRRAENPAFDLAAIPDDDPSTFAMLERGDTTGVFQLESDGMRRVAQELKPSVLADIIALVALYRPGPMELIPQYISNKHGRTTTKYLHPKLEPILAETYSVPLYQEQVMRIARDIAGFSMSEADELRKVMGKKLKDKIPVYRKKFIEGAVEQGLTAKLGEDIFAFVEPFAGYGFNKCAHGSTEIELPDGTRIALSAAYEKPPERIMAMWPDGEIRPHKVERIVRTGRKALLHIRTASGKSIKVTREHRLLTTEGYREAGEMTVHMELITAPRRMTMKQRVAPRASMSRLNPNEEQRARGSRRVKAYQASLASSRACYDTAPGYGRCSIASNGMWCASEPERHMCEWLLEQGVSFEMHRVLGNGRICDFYFNGIYWEMDVMDRAPAYFAEKYGELPYVVVTPEDFQSTVLRHLGVAHALNGDPIVSIEPCDAAMTYDIEMAPDGPLNYIANRIVSHNSHAAAYGWIAYQTAYLKANYPHAYLAALMTSVGDKTDKLVEYIEEARKIGIAVLPPDVNTSLESFTVVDREIRFGLAAIKGVGEGAVKAIIAARESGGPFTDLFDLTGRVDSRQANRKVYEALIKSGALDSLGSNRAELLDAVDDALELSSRIARERELGQTSLFGGASEETAAALAPRMRRLAPPPMLEQLAWEKETLGIFVSGHPLAGVAEALKRTGAVEIRSLRGMPEDEFVTVAGLLTDVRRTLTKAQQQILYATVEDQSGSVEAIVFPKSYGQLQGAFQKDAIVVVKGRLRFRSGKASDESGDAPPSVHVSEAVPFDRPPERAPGLGWHVEVQDRAQIDALAKLAHRWAGEVPVVVHVGERAQRMRGGIAESPMVKRELETIFARVWQEPA